MSLVLDCVVTLLALTTVALYSWSTNSHFRSDQRPAGLNVVVVLVLLATLIDLVLLWAQIQPSSVQFAGILIILASLALFWWAIVVSHDFGLTHVFDKTKPTALLSTGPYAYVRHPFYTSYIIFWAAFGLATWSIWSLVPLVALVVIYIRAAHLEEEKFIASPLADTYRAYRKRAGLFWPKPGG